jgi:hypothetical protein
VIDLSLYQDSDIIEQRIQDMSKMNKNNRPRVKNGGKSNNLGRQSIIYGLDNNPNITAADPKAKFIAKNKK